MRGTQDVHGSHAAAPTAVLHPAPEATSTLSSFDWEMAEIRSEQTILEHDGNGVLGWADGDCFRTAREHNCLLLLRRTVIANNDHGVWGVTDGDDHVVLGRAA